ncbi:CYFA0S01e04390g1_1 [Cyberlindnera fabianii]|uniref:CYFA0S01e04390g1_1 n=1 Tax=Cyberlindnera fabianii TaxID=36022 RepID=A0A061AGT8_CYBFA|nr:CYFA0S01e04390g1_1 [Cyberlindnera fabianii]
MTSQVLHRSVLCQIHQRPTRICGARPDGRCATPPHPSLSTNTLVKENARVSGHQHNPSINSLGSLVEPLTPPDLGDQFVSSQNNSLSVGSANTTPLSNFNSNIGGNTFRSRFKSLPLATEIDQKFNQFNINNLQKLSTYTPSPTTSSNVSSSSIPQIPLQGATDGDKQRSTSHVFTYQSKDQRQPLYQHHSMPSIHQRRESTPSVTTPNFRNFDELNLIPIDQLDVLKLAVDQYGCRYLQKKLEVDTSTKDKIFNRIFDSLIDLVVHPFGNYLIQKLVDCLSTQQKNLVIEKIHEFLFPISVNQYGTRSLQKIIDNVSNTYQMDLIIKGLQMNDSTNPADDNNIVRLITCLNGNHVIQKCIYKFPSEKLQFIVDAICSNDNIVRVSTHKHGCCVLQKLLNKANLDQILKISQVMLTFVDVLVNDQFGNFAIQFLFELDYFKSSNSLDFLVGEFFSKIYNNFVRLSCLKFSSNVIEKLIKVLKAKFNFFYLNEIIKLINRDFEALITDKFGNYVIQTMIDELHDVTELSMEMNMLITNVKNHLPIIKAAPYARKIQLKIQQLETNYTSNMLQPQYYTPRDYPPMHTPQAGIENQSAFSGNININPYVANPYVSSYPRIQPYTSNDSPFQQQHQYPNASAPQSDFFNQNFLSHTPMR